LQFLTNGIWSHFWKEEIGCRKTWETGKQNDMAVPYELHGLYDWGKVPELYNVMEFYVRT